jgi:ribosome-binding protein aMBF1 (putative translation factor)
LLGDDTGPVVTNRDPGTREEWTPAQIEAAVNEMVLAKLVGDLLAEARKQSGMTMNEVAEKMSVTRGRVKGLEHPEASLEVATVARMAGAMGYKLTLTLDPQTPDRHPLKVELT